MFTQRDLQGTCLADAGTAVNNDNTVASFQRLFYFNARGSGEQLSIIGECWSSGKKFIFAESQERQDVQTAEGNLLPWRSRRLKMRD